MLVNTVNDIKSIFMNSLLCGICSDTVVNFVTCDSKYVKCTIFSNSFLTEFCHKHTALCCFIL